MKKIGFNVIYWRFYQIILVLQVYEESFSYFYSSPLQLRFCIVTHDPRAKIHTPTLAAYLIYDYRARTLFAHLLEQLTLSGSPEPNTNTISSSFCLLQLAQLPYTVMLSQVQYYGLLSMHTSLYSKCWCFSLLSFVKSLHLPLNQDLSQSLHISRTNSNEEWTVYSYPETANVSW